MATMTIGEALKETRKNLGLSQTEMAYPSKFLSISLFQNLIILKLNEEFMKLMPVI